jgi:hypothetical protein
MTTARRSEVVGESNRNHWKPQQEGHHFPFQMTHPQGKQTGLPHRQRAHQQRDITVTGQ